MQINLNDFETWRNTNCPEQADQSLEMPSMDQSNFKEWDTDQWESVPGIGPTLAKRLVESGPFDSIDDVRGVKGISEKVFQNIVHSVG